MAGLGPRVGGAHVDVNLKFDDKSLKTVGKQIHKQLQEVSQKNTETYRSIGRNAVTAWRGALGSILAGAPLIGSAMSAAGGGITALAGAVYSLGQTSFAALPIFTSLGIAGLTLSIGMNNFATAVSEVDPKKLQLLLSTMPKSMQEAVLATRALNQEMRAAIWPKLFAGVGPALDKFRQTGVIQKGLGLMAEQLNGLALSVLKYANSAEGLSTIDKFFENNAKVFGALSKAVVPFLDGFLKLVNALTPAALRLAGRITDVGKRFQSWTSAEGFGKRINDMMLRAEKTAGKLIDVVVNLYKAFVNVFNATNPASNALLDMLVNASQRFLDFTSSVEGEKSIAKWAMDSVKVLGQFGETAEAVFKVIAELADPRVISSFLETVEGAFVLLGKLPLDKMVTAFVTVAEALQPVSSLFLAIIIGGAALNIMLGSLIGQFAGVIGILSGIVKFKILTSIFKNMSGGAKGAGAAAAGAGKKVGILSRAWGALKSIMDKIRGVLSKVFPFLKKTGDVTGDVGKKAGKLSGAFKPVLSILGRLAKFAGPVGLAVWIGSLIAGSEKLQGKFGKLWDAVKEVGTALKDAFSEILTALEPLGPAAKAVGKALGPIFDFLDMIATLAIGLVIDTITYAFKSLAKVIEGVGKIVAGFIDVIIGIATLDGDKILGGLKKMVSGIGPLLQGAFGLIVTFFAPARLLKLGATAFKALGGGIKSALPGILRAVGSMVMKVIGFVARLPGRLLSLGGQAIMKLAGAVKNNAPKVIAGAARIFTAVVGWIARLPGRLLTLGVQAVTRLAGAVSRGIGRLRTIAGNIFTAVSTQIAKMPGKLLTLGQQAITKLAGAVQAGVARLRTIAGNIKDAVVNALTGLPGKMLEVGKNIIGGLIDGVLSKLGALKDAAGKVASAIKDALPGSPVKEGPLTAWNRGGGASGGGRNVIDAILAGLQDTGPITKAMAGVAGAIGGAALTPAMAGPGMRGGGPGQTTRNLNITINNPYRETASDSLTRTTRNLAYLGLT